MNQDDIDPYSHRVIGCAIEVHRALGPGLMERVYEECLCQELAQAGLRHERQRAVPVVYKGRTLDLDFRADVIVEDTLLLEIKAQRETLPLHEAQLLTYMKLTGIALGLLLNFNVSVLKDGVRRRRL